MTDKVRSVFTAYILSAEPTVTHIGDPSSGSGSSFGPLATNPAVAPGKLQVSSDLMNKASQTVDFVQTIRTADLEFDVFEDHRPTHTQNKKKRDPLPNPNKFLCSQKLNSAAYEESLNKTKKSG